jgi:hypothetical protein
MSNQAQSRSGLRQALLVAVVTTAVGGIAGYLIGQRQAWQVVSSRAWRVWIGGACTGADSGWMRLATELTGDGVFSEEEIEGELLRLASQDAAFFPDLEILESADRAAVEAAIYPVRRPEFREFSTRVNRLRSLVSAGLEPQDLAWGEALSQWEIYPTPLRAEVCGAALFPNEIEALAAP